MTTPAELGESSRKPEDFSDGEVLLFYPVEVVFIAVKVYNCRRIKLYIDNRTQALQ
jgi:hypothetical protein